MLENVQCESDQHINRGSCKTCKTIVLLGDLDDVDSANQQNVMFNQTTWLETQEQFQQNINWLPECTFSRKFNLSYAGGSSICRIICKCGMHIIYVSSFRYL